MERENLTSYEVELSPINSELQPPTFGDRLREEVKEWGRTGVRIWSTIIIGTATSTAVAVILERMGMGEKVALWSAVGVMVPSIFLCDKYLAPRLIDKISWLKPSPKFRNQQ